MCLKKQLSYHSIYRHISFAGHHWNQGQHQKKTSSSKPREVRKKTFQQYYAAPININININTLKNQKKHEAAYTCFTKEHTTKRVQRNENHITHQTKQDYQIERGEQKYSIPKLRDEKAPRTEDGKVHDKKPRTENNMKKETANWIQFVQLQNKKEAQKAHTNY